MSVAGGGHIFSAHVTHPCDYKIQGKEFTTTFKVLDLSTFDVILGCDWIYFHSPFCLDLPNRFLIITKDGHPIVFNDHTAPPEQCMITVEKLQHLLKKGVLGYVLQIHHLETAVTTPTSPVPAEIEPILQQYADVFQEIEGLPPSRDCDRTIPLQAGATPPSLRPYVPHYHKSSMEDIITKLLKNAEIQPSVSPYSSPAVMVRKRDGSWRLCVDYRQLNKLTIKNKFPMPVIEDLLDELHGATVFNKLDLRSGYHQIRMATPDIPKTTFKTHLGLYEYTVMPFGLTNAPATFQYFMNTIFGDLLRKCILVFFDDILIYSPDMETHCRHLQLALDILRQHKLSLKLSKCSFATSKVSYLGHIISADGVSTDPSKIVDVLNWKTPVSASKLRGFLGLTGYYRRFVKGYGFICRPLHDALRKDAFVWGPSQEQAFQQLKTIMTTCPVLALPDFTQSFTIEADACATGIGAVLMQNGRPLAYFSQGLGPRPAAQSVYEKEALAILEAIKKWRHYIWGHKLVIKTDHKA